MADAIDSKSIDGNIMRVQVSLPAQMINIIFSSKDNKIEFEKAISEYNNIWKEDGKKIIESLEKISGLRFPIDTITITVYEGVSKSGSKTEPMMLRASYSLETKKATIIHELAHRLLDYNKIQTPTGWDTHQLLNLFLYDVWLNLYGKEFAIEQVNIEKKRNERYQKSWDWVLTMNSNDRAIKFSEVIGKSPSSKNNKLNILN